MHGEKAFVRGLVPELCILCEVKRFLLTRGRIPTPWCNSKSSLILPSPQDSSLKYLYHRLISCFPEKIFHNCGILVKKISDI